MGNNHVVLISGKSASGKSASLRNLANSDKVVYFCTEANKPLPFANNFQSHTVTDPTDIPRAVRGLSTPKFDDRCKTIVIDSLTYMMGLYENQIVRNSEDSRTAWGDYAAFLSSLMLEDVAASSRDIIITGHTADIYNEKELVMETMVKVKGSLMNVGVESFFTHVVSTKKMALNKLEDFQNDLLNITEEEELLGFKYVYQTRLTRETVNERIRSPIGLWDVKETYIDNDAQLVLNRLHEYYQ